MWNRQRFVKDPVSGKRQARLNDPDEWLSSEVAHLRIVDDALWAAVKKRQDTQRIAPFADDQSGKPRIDERRRARYLLSGLSRCGHCGGGGYAMISADMLGCSTARNKGTCANRVNIRRDVLEQRVLTSLHTHLMDPALFGEFCGEFTRELNRIRMEGSAAIAAARAEVDKLERDMDATVDMMIRLGPSNATERLSAKVDRLDARQKSLQNWAPPTTPRHFRSDLIHLA
ncbi:recombinase zinc beta ribbon domain-containing protein [Sphingomonas sp.]|uniref:recombinase zinc beta ribbon domain-containing protein n=1 Tax=Sphingomonas sp. TaxID=28214 RepID=UPI0035656EB3